MRRVVVVRPQTDGIERIMSSEWAEPIRNRLEVAPDVDLADLSHGVSREHVEGTVRAGDGFMFFGHGTPDTLGRTPALLDVANLDRLSDGIIVAFACESAIRLGPAAIAAGVQGYLGFDDYLLIYPAPAHAVSSAVFDSLDRFAQGRDLSEVRDSLAGALDRIFDDYAFKSRRFDLDAGIILACTRLMRRSLCAFGKDAARLATEIAYE
jgi:hypothetical protein